MRFTAYRLLIVPIILLGFAPSAQAQESVPNLPDSLSLGTKELHLGNTARAKDLYRWVLKHDRKSNPARMGLGRVAVAESDWGEGCDQFQDVIESDTGSIAARYYCGICRREYGTQLAWIMRRGQWEKSQANFLWVLARDSSYEDILYQLALLYRYRDEVEPALDMARLQVDRRPDLNSAALGLFKLYKYTVAVVSPGDIFHLLGRRHDIFALYFAAEALRRQQRYDEAERFLKEVLGRTETVPLQAVYGSLAMISFARGKPAEGEAYYWQAVDHISSWLGSAILFEGIKYIITDEELKEYNAIASDRKKSLFFHLFWNLRNPSPAAKTNVRLAEHVRRILRAEHDFEYYGFRSHFNDPDKLHYLSFPKAFYTNQEFNDKGLVYIRHGEPDDMQRTIGEELNDSWLYNEKTDSPKRVFYFTQSNSANNNWRLTSFPEDPAMWEDLVMWDNRFNRLLNGQALEQAEVQDALRQESGTIVRAGLTSDENTWKKETKVFYMPHSVNAFRAEGGKTLLNVSYALPLGEIVKEAADTLKAFRVEVGISLNRANGVVLSSTLDTLTFPAGPGAAGSFVELYRFELSPDSVRIAMHARPLEASMVSTWTSRIRVPAFPVALPVLSDVEFLLPSNAKSSIEIDGVKVIASPFDAVPREKPLFVYWQMYNLTKDIAGKTAYHSRVLLTPGETGPGDGSTVVYEKEHTGQDESAPELARLDVHAFDKGLYTLTVEITDRKMVRTFSGSRLVRLTGD